MTCGLVVYSLLVIVTADQIVAEVGRQLLCSGALGAIAGRFEGLGQVSGGLRLGC